MKSFKREQPLKKEMEENSRRKKMEEKLAELMRLIFEENTFQSKKG